MSDREHARSPIETALEYCVYAPLGFGLEARSLLPRFVDRGRNQIVLARVIGKYAIRKGSEAAEGLLGPAGAPAMSLLRGLGLLPPEPAPSPAASGMTASAASATPAGPDGERRAAGEPTAPADVPAPAGRPQPPFPAETLAIPDYESLSASQVVPRLEGLTAEELEAVRTYETATRGRKTILNKIAQLQSG